MEHYMTPEEVVTTADMELFVLFFQERLSCPPSHLTLWTRSVGNSYRFYLHAGGSLSEFCGVPATKFFFVPTAPSPDPYPSVYW